MLDDGGVEVVEQGSAWVMVAMRVSVLGLKSSIEGFGVGDGEELIWVSLLVGPSSEESVSVDEAPTTTTTGMDTEVGLLLVLWFSVVERGNASVIGTTVPTARGVDEEVCCAEDVSSGVVAAGCEDTSGVLALGTLDKGITVPTVA